MNEDTLGYRDKSNYCEFHKDVGHETEACWQLKKEIEHLVQMGKLKEFVGRPQKEIEERGKQVKDCQTLGTIHTIFGGSSGGDSNSARKRRARKIYSILPQQRPNIRPPLSFSEIDSEYVHTPHNDALVIEGIMENLEFWWTKD
ncbi:uncharacterized protein LOC119370087, partial [Jatropha curcas]|uniref:uncharacterized protein LOC119370087 n=1 Tax=Jatropha curcas TaxID=180498 RepID=UPI001894126E